MGTLYISNKNGNIFSDNFYEGGVEGGMKWPFKGRKKERSREYPIVEPVAFSQNFQVINNDINSVNANNLTTFNKIGSIERDSTFTLDINKIN